MSDYEKPPLGASPTYISASDRIKELAQAIVNHADRADLNRGHIYLWASEILGQIELIEKSEVSGLYDGTKSGKSENES